MNLGCGTLLVLVLLVLAAGHLIPRGPGRAEVPLPQAEKERPGAIEPQQTNAVRRGIEGRANLQASSSSRLSPKQSPPKPEPVQGVQRNEQISHAFDLRAMEAQWMRFLAEAEVQIQGFKLPIEGLPSLNGQSSLPSPPVSEKKQEAELLEPRNETRPGQDKVFNNPFTQSVGQVEQYLRQHVHDAASLEILGWGVVEKAPAGYSVSCTYRSKNVLGKLVTQTQRFVLDRQGVVVDVNQ